MVFPFGFGEVPRLRCSTGERFGDREIIIELLFSFSGDGDDPPPVAEFLRDGVKRMVASRCLNLNEFKIIMIDRWFNFTLNRNCIVLQIYKIQKNITELEHCSLVHRLSLQTGMQAAS